MLCFLTQWSVAPLCPSTNLLLHFISFGGRTSKRFFVGKAWILLVVVYGIHQSTESGLLIETGEAPIYFQSMQHGVFVPKALEKWSSRMLSCVFLGAWICSRMSWLWLCAPNQIWIESDMAGKTASTPMNALLICCLLRAHETFSMISASLPFYLNPEQIEPRCTGCIRNSVSHLLLHIFVGFERRGSISCFVRVTSNGFLSGFASWIEVTMMNSILERRLG